jgi:acyl-[acyl-carrier-protein]-phospholipid O-acyltransferase / long-chain-fatty-acid--[acyl-carrier-protein] ligase
VAQARQDVTIPGVPGYARNLAPHLASCFAGAAVDNVFRVAAVAALTAAAAAGSSDPGTAERNATHLSSLAMLAFTIPFVAFAPLAGALGDRLPKHLIMRWVRFADLPVLLLGGLGLYTGHTWLLLAALALLGTTSAFFGPIKLSCIPELAGTDRLPSANAWVQGVTIVAIVIGMGLASVADPKTLAALGISMQPAVVVSIVGCCVAALGLVGAFLVPRLPAQDPHAAVRPFAFVSQGKVLFERPGLAVPAFSLAGFWGLAAAVGVLIAPIAKFAWGLDALGPSLLGLCLMVGIIIGASLAPAMMVSAFPAGLPLIGAMLAGGSLVAAGWLASGVITAPQIWAIGEPLPGSLIAFGGLLALAGVGSGLWDVPMNVLLQERSEPSSRNRVMAAMGITTAVGMVAASGLCNVLTEVAGLTSAQLVLLLGGIAVGLAAGGMWLYRGQIICWCAALAIRLLFKVEVQGLEHVPKTGGCVVISNHTSLADGVILAAILPRRTKFMVYKGFCDMPVLGGILHAWGVIPVDAKMGARALIAAVQTATNEAKNGGSIGIFPEGKLTRSGVLDGFKGGIERIARTSGAAIAPCAMQGLWRTPYSYAERKNWWPLLRIPVRVRFGPALPPETPASELRQAVAALECDLAIEHAARDRRTLGSVALGRCRWKAHEPAVVDAGGTLPRWQLAALATALRPRLQLAKDERAVGVLLPPGRGGSIVNLCLALAGRTAVNLNHTAGPVQLKRMCEMAGIRTIISAAPYLKRIGDPGLPHRMLLIEQMLPAIPKLSVIWHLVLTLLLPPRWRDQGRPNDVACLVFSSGSTGDPKGVQLTHAQILANCDGIRRALDVGAGDVVLTPLPLFHSFGLVPGMWLGLECGFAIAAHPDPTDAKGLGDLAARAKATFAITTATFVRGWLRRIPAEQLQHLRFAAAGAEKCPKELREAFKAKYGADLLEGYGCTELAPLVSVNLQAVTRVGETEIRTRDSTVGRAIPGIHVFATHMETRAALPTGQEGLLVVRTPARMQGYLGRDDLTTKAFLQGGYDTGDVGIVDADGFIRITGRLARFAKIAGEMVPLDTVEAALQSPHAEHCEIAVAAVADPDRGERLIVLVAGENPPGADEIVAGAAGLAALWRPKAKDVHRVDALPRLGTGKRDLSGVKKLAMEKAGA